MRGVEVFLELLAGANVRFLFGNPGTTELPINDALIQDGRFDYVLGLQEVPVMAMADGYAMASGQLGVVNLHASCGLGNALGVLYNAFREGTPLLVTAGQQDRRLALEEPILVGELVEVARPWTKFAAEVQRVEDLPTLVQRAIRVALTPPTGPVFLSLPIDIQLSAADHVTIERLQIPDSRVRPPLAGIESAASLLLEAKNPVILAGSRVCERNAFGSLVELAELLGAPVHSESVANHGRMAFPCDHALRGDLLPLWSPDVRRALAEFDVAVVVGMDFLRQYVYFEPAQPIPPDLRVIHLDEDPWQLGKNVPTEIGLIGHIDVSLRELIQAVQGRADASFDAVCDARRDRWTRRHQETRRALLQEVEMQCLESTLTPLALMKTVADVLPERAAVIEEAVTTTNTTLERLGAIRSPDGYFGQRGWTLGWGLGCAIGAKFAWPERPVLAILGDGSMMYGAAGLWTAAQREMPIVFLVCNNGGYGILKSGFSTLGLQATGEEPAAGMQIPKGTIDFVMLAESLGVRGRRAETCEGLRHELETAFRHHGPTLIEAPLPATSWTGAE